VVLLPLNRRDRTKRTNVERRLDICPYLSIRDDPGSLAAYPREDHQCGRAGNALIEPAWQRQYCLDASHIQCPVFRGQISNRPRTERNIPNRMPPAPLWMASLAVAAVLLFVTVTVVTIEIAARSSSAIASGGELLIGNVPGQPAQDTTTASGADENGYVADAENAEEADVLAGPSGPDVETRRDRYDQAGVLPFLGGSAEWPVAVGGAGPDTDAPEPPAPEPEPEPQDPAPEAAQPPPTHTVQPGETLWEIANIHGTTIDALLAANGLDDPDLIFAGAVLTIQ
jgi:hypothetical protein